MGVDYFIVGSEAGEELDQAEELGSISFLKLVKSPQIHCNLRKFSSICSSQHTPKSQKLFLQI